MTRETKIGLLVGLAFIIVIGILLSDHLTSSTEPPPATLANAGSNVRQTVTTPGGTTTQPPITNVAMQPPGAQPNVAPQQPVPTPSELQPRPQRVQIVQVGGPAPQTVPQQQPQYQPQQPPVSITGPQTQQFSQAQLMLQQPNPNDAPIITQAPAQANTVPGSLAQVAQQHGEGLVSLDSGRPVEQLVAPTPAREYVAEPGDSVSRMANRLLGANTKANRDAIIRANPSLQQDPNKVIVGRTYVIPGTGGVVAQPQVASNASTAQLDPIITQTPTQGTVSAAEYWYTVKENDSLWRIASEQLGSPASIAAIKELNKDALRGGETVYVGMKLKLPGKPIAKAN